MTVRSAAVIAGVVVAVAACTSSSRPTVDGSTSRAATTAQPIAIQGVMRLQGPLNWISDARNLHCRGVGRFDDVHVGSQVVVSADDGSTLAVTKLKTGIVVDPRSCGFDIRTTIPGGQQFYGVAVAGRPAVKFAADRIRHPSFTIGG